MVDPTSSPSTASVLLCPISSALPHLNNSTPAFFLLPSPLFFSCVLDGFGGPRVDVPKSPPAEIDFFLDDVSAVCSVISTLTFLVDSPLGDF